MHSRGVKRSPVIIHCCKSGPIFFCPLYDATAVIYKLPSVVRFQLLEPI